MKVSTALERVLNLLNSRNDDDDFEDDESRENYYAAFTARVPTDFVGNMARLEEYSDGSFSTKNSYGVLFLAHEVCSDFMRGNMFRLTTTSRSTLDAFKAGLISREVVFERGTHWLVSTNKQGKIMAVVEAKD